MRCISIRQPWATAILHLDKDVENRTVAAMWQHLVGETVAVHASARMDLVGMADPVLRRAFRAAGLTAVMPLGAVLGVVTVTGLHWADECGGCSPWAQGPWIGERRICHLTLTDPRPLTTPIPARGKLGAWHLPPLIETAVRSDLASTGVSA